MKDRREPFTERYTGGAYTPPPITSFDIQPHETILPFKASDGGLMNAAIRVHQERIENSLREMLGRWVSELEPSACYRGIHLIGLCVKGDPTGTIIVRPQHG